MCRPAPQAHEPSQQDAGARGEEGDPRAEAHPGWGPRTLHAYLRREYPDVAWPCPSTIGAILKRHGLVKKRRRRPARLAWGHTRIRADRPNRVWTADFKGQFRLGNGALCYPLTVADACSR